MQVSLSIERILNQLIERKQALEATLTDGKLHNWLDSVSTLVTTLYCIGGVAMLSIGKLEWINTYTVLLGASLVLLTMFFREQKKGIIERREKARYEYDELRKYLMSKVSSSFCLCKDSCNCKESFLSYVEREKGINLYY